MKNLWYNIKDSMKGFGTIEKGQKQITHKPVRLISQKQIYSFSMAGAKWCIMLNFAGPVGDCCIIFESKA